MSKSQLRKIMQKKLTGTAAQRRNHYALAIALTLATVESSHAVGFLLPNQDPEAIGRGDAFAATADNPSAIYYNPAGITQLPGAQVSLGIYAISAYTSFSSPNGNAHTDPTPQYVPQVYAVYSLKQLPISFGLGVYAPYGLGINWGEPPFASEVQKGNLTYVTANPVVAWKVCKMLSVAAGVTVNYADASLQNAVAAPPPLPTGVFKFTGNSLEPGFNIGILFQPHPMWSFGINYHSETDMNFSGKASQTAFPPGFGVAQSTDSNAKINFPQTVVGGISFRPTPKWNLEFDLNWTQWSTISQIVIQNSPFFGQPITVTLNYRDSFIYDFGVTRQLGKGYYASVGYIYSQNSSPDYNFNPLVPDADLNLGNFGFGHHGQHFDWAIAYQFAYNGGRTISNNANPQVEGTYKTFNNAINGSVTFKF